MFVWTSGFQKSLAHTDFNMFVDEWTSANESPGVTILPEGSQGEVFWGAVPTHSVEISVQNESV